MRDTIDMAREAGIIHPEMVSSTIKAFEALVRADERNRTWTQEHWTEYERSIAAVEREACAKVCEGYTDNSDADHESHGYACAAAIRAREYP
jgi:hypothetical protein